MSVNDQIAASKEQIREMKKVAPYIFHEYQELQHAQRDLEKAKDRLEKAQKRWEQL